MADGEAGRPTSRTPEVVAQLVASFQNGLNITQACLQAGISRETYRLWCKDDEVFLAKMELARHFPSMKSRQNIVKQINDGDEHASKWWLERKDRKEFATRSEHDVEVNPVEKILEEYGLRDSDGGDGDGEAEKPAEPD